MVCKQSRLKSGEPDVNRCTQSDIQHIIVIFILKMMIIVITIVMLAIIMGFEHIKNAQLLN